MCDSVSLHEKLPTFWKDRHVFIFSVKQSGLLNPKNEGVKVYRNV